MKIHKQIIIFFILSFCLFITSSCSIEKRRYRKGLHVERKSRINEEKTSETTKIQLSAGSYRIVQSPATSQYFKNHFAPDIRFSIFIKRFFIAADLRSMTFIPKREFQFNDFVVGEQAKFNHNRFSIMSGYKFNIKYNLSFEPYIGYLITDFRVINEKDLNINFGNAKVNGITAGFVFNKLFPLGDDAYFVLYLNNNLNYANYKKVNNGFGNYFYGISIGFGLRAAF